MPRAAVPRRYGPIRYPYLTTSWRFSVRVNNGNVPGWAQTVYVFRKGGHGRVDSKTDGYRAMPVSRR